MPNLSRTVSTVVAKQVGPARNLKPRNIGTVADAAKRWALSEKTIRRMINAGELTGYFATPRTLRVDLLELDALMESRATRKVVA